MGDRLWYMIVFLVSLFLIVLGIASRPLPLSLLEHPHGGIGRLDAKDEVFNINRTKALHSLIRTRPRHNVVLGYYTSNRDIHSAFMFVSSWKRVSPHTEVIIFVDDVNSRMSQAITAAGAVAMPFPETGAPPEHVSEPSFHRFYVWRKYLLDNAHHIRVAVTTDVRDSVAQVDLFQLHFIESLQYKHEVFVGEEGGEYCAKIPIVEEPINKKWILDCFKDEGLELVGSRTVLCSGFMVGNPLAVAAMTGSVIEIPKHYCPERRVVAADDQGFFNYAIYSNFTVNTNGRGMAIRAIPNGDMVLHLDLISKHAKDAKFRLDTAGRLIADDGEWVYPVLHQIDRIPRIVDHFRRMYPMYNPGDVL